MCAYYLPYNVAKNDDIEVTSLGTAAPSGRKGRLDGLVEGGGQGSELNDGVDGVSDFSIIIAQQLQNLLPTIVAQVGSQGSEKGKW
ncbi:hypothetical protein Tco_1128309 [Tanacetum coccineum]